MKINKNKIYNLSVEEAYKLLSSKKMAKNRCNLEIYKNKSTNPGGNHGGRKVGSKNKLTLRSLNKKLDLSVKSINSKIDKLAGVVEQLAKEVHEGFARQEQFNKAILARIDNLVVKNNLKE